MFQKIFRIKSKRCLFVTINLFGLMTYFQTYLEVKLLPYLMYSCKLMMREKENSNNSTPTPRNSPVFPLNNRFRCLNDISDEELQAVENIILLICHLVHLDVQFLSQICDAVVILKVSSLLHQLLLLSKLMSIVYSITISFDTEDRVCQ